MSISAAMKSTGMATALLVGASSIASATATDPCLVRQPDEKTAQACRDAVARGETSRARAYVSSLTSGQGTSVVGVSASELQRASYGGGVAITPPSLATLFAFGDGSIALHVAKPGKSGSRSSAIAAPWAVASHITSGGTDEDGDGHDDDGHDDGHGDDDGHGEDGSNHGNGSGTTGDGHGTGNTGDHGTGNTGDHGTGNTGDHGTGNTGDHGTGNTGNHGTGDTGDHGTGDTGDHGTGDTGDHGTVGTGDHGTGDHGTGDHGTGDTGDHGTGDTGDHGTGSTGDHGDDGHGGVLLEPHVVPEPVTMTLLATGLASMGGFGALRRRRRGTPQP